MKQQIGPILLVILLAGCFMPAKSASTMPSLAGFTPSTTVSLSLAYANTPEYRGIIKLAHNSQNIDDMTVSISAASVSAGFAWIYGHTAAPLLSTDTYWSMAPQSVLLPAGVTQSNGTVPFGPECTQPSPGVNIWYQCYIYRAQIANTNQLTVSSQLQTLILKDM